MLVLDIVGAVLSLMAVFLFTRANIMAWPVSLFANVVNAYLYGLSGIYGHTALEFIYIVMNFYGWYYWKREAEQVIQLTPLSEAVSLLIFVVGMFPGLFYILHVYTDSTIPGLDSLTTLLNVSAAWMMCRGRVESWIAWFVVDSIYALIYWYKALPFHLVLMLIYLVLAVRGFQQWQLKSHRQAEWQEFA